MHLAEVLASTEAVLMGATFVGMPPFPQAAHTALADTQLRANLAHATSTIRDKRAHVVGEVDDWEAAAQQAGPRSRTTMLRHLDEHLVRLEESLTAAGAFVHWARDAAEANAIIAQIARRPRRDEVVKVKSMATQEIELNEALAAQGISAWETDLAELIVQLGDDLPSHILVPAIHRNRAEIREIFRTPDGGGRPAGAGRPDRRARRARRGGPAAPAGEVPPGQGRRLRRQLRRRRDRHPGRGGVRGQRPDVPDPARGPGQPWSASRSSCRPVEDLEVFLQLLPRSITGERMNPYTSMWTGVRPGDGPQEVHVVLLDNGRTNVLADEVGRQALRCIRCSACLNVCPVYERTGGHAYGSVYPGPDRRDPHPAAARRRARRARSTRCPYASSLCGACYEVCPVEIDIPEVLVHLRAKVVDAHRDGRPRARTSP